MAEAIISGMIKNQFVKSSDIYVTNHSNRDRLTELADTYDIETFTDDKSRVAQANIVVLSMKPADTEAAIASIQPYLSKGQLVISVAAGVDTEAIESFINKDVAVIRSMPNTSASVALSATAISAGRFASEEDVKLAEELFNTIGITEVVLEEDIHAVTGVSGSGPAYIYYLVEAMEEAAIEAGLTKDVANALVKQTIIGAAEMLNTSDDSAKVLKEKVMSPGGTTEAGIKMLQSYDFKEAVSQCVQNAKKRSIELGEK